MEPPVPLRMMIVAKVTISSQVNIDITMRYPIDDR